MQVYSKIINDETKELECIVCGEKPLDGYSIMDYELAYNGKYYLKGFAPTETEEEKAQKEKARIQELFMTRSDFFDGTIDAWGVGEDELLILIQRMLISLPLENKQKLKAINNFRNALNFYRKHDLFKMLVGYAIPLNETYQITIMDEELDKFFDEVDKGNKATAWEYLPQPTAIPIEPSATERPTEESSYDDI